MCFPMEKAVEHKWDFVGLQCVITRADLIYPDIEEQFTAHRCGYVRIPAGHPWHGRDYDDIPVEAHGGLTFSRIEPCEHADGIGYWIGFDCHHLGDAGFPLGDPRDKYRFSFEQDAHYWTLDEVKAEVERLATQVTGAIAEERKSGTLVEKQP